MDIIVISAIIFSLCHIAIPLTSWSEDTACRIASNILFGTMTVIICTMYIEMGFAAICVFGLGWLQALWIKNKIHSKAKEKALTSTNTIVKKEE